MKKTIAVTFAIVSLATAGVLLAGCGSKEKKIEVTVFAAKSLNGVMDELCEKYNSEHPNVTFQTNYDSSGTLMTQIKEGAFSFLPVFLRWMSCRQVLTVVISWKEAGGIF